MASWSWPPSGARAPRSTATTGSDRPPLLIAAFAVADTLGGPLALRLIGLAAVLVAIGAAASVGWYASGRRALGAVAAAWVVAVFLATPLFGTRIVDGELLASPLVLGGLAALLASYGAVTRMRMIALRGLAGGLAAGAFLVKQNMVDVLVVAVVLGVHALWRRGWPRVRLGCPEAAVDSRPRTTNLDRRALHANVWRIEPRHDSSARNRFSAFG